MKNGRQWNEWKRRSEGKDEERMRMKGRMKGDGIMRREKKNEKELRMNGRGMKEMDDWKGIKN